MRFRKVKVPETVGRRSRAEQTATTPTYNYRSRRSAEDVKTGRGIFKGDRAPNKDAKPWVRTLKHRFGLVVLFIVLIVCAVNALILTRNPKIVLLSPDSQLYLHKSYVYQSSAADILKSSIFSTNKITVDTSGVSRKLLAQYPELSSVSITLPLLGHRPIVYLSPSEPSLVLVGANGTYVLDNRGRALLKSDTASFFSYLNVPIVIDHTNLHIVLNKLALTSNDINFIQTVAYQLKAKSIGVTSMALPAGGGELDVNISGQPYYVKFNLQNSDARQQAGTYLAALTYLQSSGKKPLAYIDVRTDGRAYFK